MWPQSTVFSIAVASNGQFAFLRTICPQKPRRASRSVANDAVALVSLVMLVGLTTALIFGI